MPLRAPLLLALCCGAGAFQAGDVFRRAHALYDTDVVRQIVARRVTSPAPPSWYPQSWSDWLLSLDDDELAVCEEHGLRAALRGGLAGRRADAAPADLRELVGELEGLEAALAPPLSADELSVASSAPPRVKPSKMEQLLAVEAIVRGRCDGTSFSRFVDMGAGLGHLCRHLAAAFARPALGLEIDPDKVAKAEELSHAWKTHPMFRKEVGAAGIACSTSFQLFDGLAPFGGIADVLEPGDFVTALHPCGLLGDSVITGVAEADGASLLLVSCCLPKVRSDHREPISAAGRALNATVPRMGLKKANMPYTSGSFYTPALQKRYALWSLLRAVGSEEEMGFELDGLPSRAARTQDFPQLTARALRRRGLPPVDYDFAKGFERRAEDEYPRMRRLSLPIPVVGQIIELMVVLDRAARAEEGGKAVTVQRIFDARHSPRNLGILAL